MTFPSHYTMATGLYPEHHGIVSNTMYDPAFDSWFRISDPDAVTDPRWWEGEPIWVTAEKQHQIAATFYWPGTDAPIQGVRPTYWKRFDPHVPNAVRVNQVLAWLDLPDGKRPTLITLYFGDVDRAAHDFDIDSDEVAEAIRQVDTDVGALLDGLDARRITDRVNIIVVSDHGIARRSPERVILLDDYIDLDVVRVIDWNPIAALHPTPERVDDVFEALVDAHPHLRVYRRDEIPARLHYRDHRRIAPIIAIADEGWSISNRSYYRRRRRDFEGGTHGYDNALLSMGALFIASGPAFQEEITVPPFQSVHLYELMCHILGLRPAPNDGSLDSVRVMMRQ